EKFASHEKKAALLHIVADCIRLARSGRNIGLLLQRVLPGACCDEQLDLVADCADHFVDFEECPGMGQSRLHLELVTHDAGILQNFVEELLCETSYFLRVEISKSFPVTVTLSKDGGPAESGLGAFQDQEFELRPVIPYGDAPFPVVILDVLQAAVARPV